MEAKELHIADGDAPLEQRNQVELSRESCDAQQLLSIQVIQNHIGQDDSVQHTDADVADATAASKLMG